MKLNASVVLAALIALVAGLIVFRAHGDKPTSTVKIGETENFTPITPKSADLVSPVKIEKPDEQWKKQLTPSQFVVLRQAGTERAFSSPLLNEHGKGVFQCAACGLSLFASDGKFESGTGWPSFTKPFLASHIVIGKDNSFLVERDEVRCARCGSHIGHVFDDGPAPAGQRYCMNGVALKFEPRP